jgi:hypothetical protein
MPDDRDERKSEARGGRAGTAPSGLAHVATVSFLASRAAPTAGFWIALAGGTALARAAERRGARQGYGVSVGAMLETVAIMGPARFGVPLTQAASAPLLGRLEARGHGALPQILACAAIRLLHNAATTAFFIWVITGGLEAYAGTYDALADRVGLIPGGVRGALAITAAGLLGWAAFASTVQVLVYRRGLRRWPIEPKPDAPGSHHSTSDERSRGESAPTERMAADLEGTRRFDPRAVAAAAAIAFGALLVSTAWPVLAASAAWLALATLTARPDRQAVPTGLVLALLLAAGAFVFTLGGGLGLDLALRRASRAALLVLVATWLRAAAGAAGLREVSRRTLRRLSRIPSVPEATRVLDDLGSERRLVAAGRSLLARLGAVRKRPLPILDAVLAWVAGESLRFRANPPRARRLALAVRPRDWALVVLAGAPLLALAGS